MSQYASTSIPKPKNWQDFESHICVLFQCILDDPNTLAHGRQGQAQKGVDVYGRRARQENSWVGVQCKLKIDSQEVKKAELENEVAEAKKFQPALSELIIVTTAPDDAKIQEVAREITQQHEEIGLFSVDVWGWGMLEREIVKYRDAMEAFHPDLTPFSRYQESIGNETLSLVRESSDKQEQLIELVKQMAASNGSVGEAAADTSSATDEAIEQTVHSEIDGYRDLLRSGKPRTAKGLLEALKARVWETASGRVRFRITTNIGATQLKLGQETLAAEAFLEAADYDPADRIGMANVALAHLIMSAPEMAIAAAKNALQCDPNNAAAAAHLISGHIVDLTVSDPFSLVPESLHDAPEVLASAINFLSQRGGVEWRRYARDAAERHRGEKLLQRRAAEAVLDEAVSTQHFAVGGISGDDVTVKDVENAASVLQSMWDDTLASEEEYIENALPHNLALALWTLNDLPAAATVLDHALERVADDGELRELRAALHMEGGDRDAALALVGDEAHSTGAAILQARALLAADPQRARTVIQGKDFSDAPKDQKLAAEQVVIESLMQEGLSEQALARAERLIDDHPGNVVPLLELARIQRNHVVENAEKTLTRAVDALSDGSPVSERFMVASALDEVGRFDEAGAVLDGHVDVGRDSPALRLLISSYIKADRRTAAYELLTKLPENVASQPNYLRARVAIHTNRKDFSAARDALDRYLDLEPDDLEMRLRWLGLCLRLKQHDRIEAYLSTDVEELSGPPDLRIELAHWLNQFGFVQRALDLAYRVFLYSASSPTVHLRYMGLALHPGCPNAIPLDLEAISENVAFKIDDGQGGQTWFVIEPNVDLRKDATYIAPDSEIALRAWDLNPATKLNGMGTVVHGGCWRLSTSTSMHFIGQWSRMNGIFRRNRECAASKLTPMRRNRLKKFSKM